MDFEQLVLSAEELNTLRVIAQGPVDCTSEWTEKTKTLCDKKLVEQKVSPAKMQIRGYVYQITKDGELYLRYINRRENEKNFENNMSTLVKTRWQKDISNRQCKASGRYMAVWYGIFRSAMICMISFAKSNVS